MCKSSGQCVQNPLFFTGKECEQKSAQLILLSISDRFSGIRQVLPTSIHMLYTEFMHHKNQPVTDIGRYLSPVSTAPINTTKYLKRRL